MRAGHFLEEGDLQGIKSRKEPEVVTKATSEGLEAGPRQAVLPTEQQETKRREGSPVYYNFQRVGIGKGGRVLIFQRGDQGEVGGAGGIGKNGPLPD